MTKLVGGHLVTWPNHRTCFFFKATVIVFFTCMAKQMYSFLSLSLCFTLWWLNTASLSVLPAPRWHVSDAFVQMCTNRVLYRRIFRVLLTFFQKSSCSRKNAVDVHLMTCRAIFGTLFHIHVFIYVLCFLPIEDYLHFARKYIFIRKHS